MSEEEIEKEEVIEGDESSSSSISADPQTEDDTQRENAGSASSARKPRRKLPVIIAVVLIVVLAFSGIGVWGYASGTFVPASAAAKYGMFDYLNESAVTEYVMTYKKQMGYENASDDEWASFLAAYNLTPDRLRLSTVYELLTEKAVEKRAKELGITVSDDEVNQAIQALKDAYSFNDDTIFENTLASYGQTLEGLKEAQRKALLQEKVIDADMEVSEPTQDEVRNTIKTYAAYYESYDKENAADASQVPAGHTIKHSYCFALKTAGSTANLSDFEKVEAYKKAFEASGKTVESFVALVSNYCDVDSVKSTYGDMGWGADLASYSNTYAKVLEATETGGVSSVFTDDGAECFLWVDQDYYIPYDTASIDKLDLGAMPSGLYKYFRDYALYSARDSMSSAYLKSLVDEMNIILYPMPADVPYNVDMSKYLTTDTSSSTSGNTSNQ